MRIKEIKLWSKWTHAKYGINMEVTQFHRGQVTLWDSHMLFRWQGSVKRFMTNFKMRK